MTVQEKLLQVQQGLKAPKSQFNAFGKYKYRACEDILEAAKPLLGDAKAILLLSDDVIAVGDRLYIRATATFSDVESGEKIVVTSQAREEESKKGMDGSQVTGAASSYARKYALNGLFLIDDAKDSDGTNDHGKFPSEPATPPPVLCSACKALIVPTLKKDGTTATVAQVLDYSKRKFGAALCPECQRKAFAQQSEAAE